MKLPKELHNSPLQSTLPCFHISMYDWQSTYVTHWLRDLSINRIRRRYWKRDMDMNSLLVPEVVKFWYKGEMDTNLQRHISYSITHWLLLFTLYTNTKGWSGASSPLKTDSLAFVYSRLISLLKLNTTTFLGTTQYVHTHHQVK